MRTLNFESKEVFHHNYIKKFKLFDLLNFPGTKKGNLLFNVSNCLLF